MVEMLPSYVKAQNAKSRHHGGAYANGYPRGNTFDISPHRCDTQIWFLATLQCPPLMPYYLWPGLCVSSLTCIVFSRFQPRASTPASRKRRKQLLQAAMIAGILGMIGLFFWPGRTTLVSIFSFGLFGGASGDALLDTVRYYDLTNSQGTARGWEREERILLCVPLRDAEPHLNMMFAHLANFTYPHHLIDLAFLVSDSKDATLEVLIDKLEKLQAHEDPAQPYGEISIIEKDFGQKVNQDVESRHGFAAQASRRKLMAQARNWLLSAALRPYHSWVYWRDVDVETAPFTILEDLMRHNKDVIVPSKSPTAAS